MKLPPIEGITMSPHTPKCGERWRHWTGAIEVEIGPDWGGHYLVKIVGTSCYEQHEEGDLRWAWDRVEADR